MYLADPHKQAKHRAIFFGLLVGVSLLASLATAGLYAITYGDRVVPATYLSGTDVSGKTRTELKQIANDLINKIGLRIVYGDRVVLANVKDMGVTLDVEKTVEEVFRIGGEQNIFLRFSPFSKKEAELWVDYDYLAFQRFLNENFADITIVPVNTTISYNQTSRQFDVISGKSGKIIDAKKLRLAIKGAVRNARSMVAKVDLSEVGSATTESAAEEARDYMNARVNLHLNLTYKGALLYFIDPPDIAAWADINPNPLTGKIDIEFDKAKIQQFLTTKVASGLASAPVDEKILVDNKTGEELMVVQHGANGKQPRDMTYLVDRVYDATVSGVDMSQELDLVEAGYKTVRIEVDDENWVEVNLSDQTTMLWNGSQLIQTFVIASGVARWPTVTGEFRIWYKTPSQTMTGGSKADGTYYYQTNVKWVSYFYKNYAFHGKYWNNIFGRPTSHGCINMREEDAKILYDFAPLGTRVIVHY